MKPLSQLLLPQIDQKEWPALSLAFLWFFFVLFSYYLIRPVRETFGSILGSKELPYLFMATFLVMLVANPIYGFLVAKLPRRILALIVYAFFAICLTVFWYLIRFEVDSTWTARAFFVWVSVFNLFAVSLFWSFLADTFDSQQAKRLFGLIAAGGTLGGLCGSFLAQRVVERIGVAQLLLIPLAFIVVLSALMLFFERASKNVRGEEVEERGEATGGTFWEGISSVCKSPYLLAICGALILAKLCGTTGYFQQTEIVSQTMADPELRTRLFARMNLAVQLLTILMQTLLVGRLLRGGGLSLVLCLLPFTYALSFLGVGLTATLAMMVAGRVAQRGMAYGMMAPAQETLFTVVSREDKYKSKGFIDTAVVRGGDVIASFLYDTLRATMSLQWVSFAMIPVTFVWAGLGWWLGKQQNRRAATLADAATNPSKSA